MKSKSTRTIAALAAVLAAVVAIVLWNAAGSPAPSTEIAAPAEAARAQESTELSRATSHDEPPPPSAEIVSPRTAVEESVERRTPPAKTPQIRVIVEVIDPNGTLEDERRSAAYLCGPGSGNALATARNGTYSYSVEPERARFLLHQEGFKPIDRWIELQADEPVHRVSVVLETAWRLRVRLCSEDRRPFSFVLEKHLGAYERFPLSITASVDPPGETTDAKHLLRNEWIVDHCQDDAMLDLEDDPPVHVSVFLGNRVLATKRLDTRVEEVTFTIGPETLDSALAHLALQVVDTIVVGPIQGVRASLVDPIGIRAQVVSDAKGRVTFRPLAPGLYRLELDCPNRSTTSRTVELVAGETLDLGVIEVSSGVEISGKTSDGGASPEREWYALIVADDGEGGATGTARHLEIRWDGRFSTTEFAAGRYILEVFSQEKKTGRFLGLSGPISLDTRAGPAKDLTIEIQAGVGVRWRPTVADFRGYQCTIRSQDGRFTSRAQLESWVGSSGVLAPNSYVIEVTRLGELVSRRPFEARSGSVTLEVP